MKSKTTNMFAATSEDLPLFSGFALTELTEEQPEWSDDGLDGYYLGCSIHLVPVERWTVGSASIRYRIQVDGPSKAYRDYADGLEQAHNKAIGHAKTINYYEHFDS